MRRTVRGDTRRISATSSVVRSANIRSGGETVAMAKRSRVMAPGNWDLGRIGPENGRAGRAVWTQTAGVRFLGSALAAQDEFWDHVRAVRHVELELDEAASRYVRYRGPRRQALAHFLHRAASAHPVRRGSEGPAKTALSTSASPRGSSMARPPPDSPRGTFAAIGSEPSGSAPSRSPDEGRDGVRSPPVLPDRGSSTDGAPGCPPARPTTTAWPATTFAEHPRGASRSVRDPTLLIEAERAIFDAVLPVVTADAARTAADPHVYGIRAA